MCVVIMEYSYFSHPNSVCMTYFNHAKLSFTFSLILFKSSIQAFIHALIPSMYITSTSDTVTKIKEMLSNVGCRQN